MNIKSHIGTALATLLIMTAAPATVASADSAPIETQGTTADGSKSCKAGKTVRLKVNYSRGLVNAKLIYNVTRTSERVINLPTGAGNPGDGATSLEVSTFQQSSSYYASAPKGKETISIKAVCV